MNGTNNSISVALCTYNGAKYLKEQLWSITEQSLSPMELVVSDDCSSDETIKILDNFKNYSIFPVRIFKNNIRKGVVKNFEGVIRRCRGNYVAICDQDDLWLPEKLANSAQAMKNAELQYGKDTPLLVHCDLKVSNVDGKVIAPSFMKLNQIKIVEKDPLRNLLVQNFVTGCTVFINRPLIEIALPIPEDALMHDWWLALIAATKGMIISISEPMVIYRQHDLNVVGSKVFFSISNIRRLANLPFLEADLAATIKQGLAYKKKITEHLDYKPPEYLERFLDHAGKNGFKTALTVLRYNIRMNPWFRNVVFILLLFKGGYIHYLRSDSENNV